MAFCEKSDELTNALVKAEYEEACKEWGNKYNSLHEGYAVLLEEIEEANTEKLLLDDAINEIWKQVKHNKLETKEIKRAIIHAGFLIKETAQIIAVLLKMQNTKEEQEK